MDKNEWLNLILNQIVKRFRRGNPTIWKNRDYIELSEKIHEETDIVISISTLKRVFGVITTSSNYFPQPSTLEALKIFSGVKVPQTKDLESKREIISSLQNINTEDLLIKAKRVLTKNRFKLNYLIALLAVFLVTSSFLMVITNRNPSPTKSKLILLKTDKVTSFLTAFFKYEISEMSDSIYFHSGQNNTKSKPITKSKGNINFMYDRPGYYQASITNKKNTISNITPILVETAGWESYVTYYYQNLDDKLYKTDISQCQLKNIYHPTNKYLNSIGVDTNRYILCHFENYKRTTVSGDNFNFETQLKNSGNWPGLVCNAIEIKIVGENSNIEVMFLNKGCSYLSYLNLSEKKIKGEESDLTAFADNFFDFREIRILNNAKSVSFFIDSKSVYNSTYNNSIGNLLGISITLHGSGFIKKINLSDLKENQTTFSFNSKNKLYRNKI